MKRLLLALAASFCTLALNAEHRDTLGILAIGNSFSEDAVEQNLSGLARSDGRCAVIGNLYIGGCPLEKHWENVKGDKPAYRYRTIDADGVLTTFPNTRISDALHSRKWDIVTLQQSSPLSGKIESYEPYMSSLIKYIRSVLGNEVKIMFQQTWAYTEYATHPSYPVYGCDQKVMYDSIMVASRRICERYGLEVIPAGTAIQNARGTRLKQLLNRDGYHLTYACGRYTAACTWYETIFDRPVSGLLYRPAHVTAEQAVICQLAASYAVRQPYAVSSFGFGVPLCDYDESHVRPFVLPDPLVSFDGRRIRTASAWERKRRPELLQVFENEVYGNSPDSVKYEKSELLETKEGALGGLAVRKRVAILLERNDKVRIDLLIYLPASARRPVPIFLVMNSHGNASVTPENDIPFPSAADLKRYGEYVSVPRGTDALNLPLESILKAGYGVATFYYADADPGFDDSFVRGVRCLYPNDLGKMCGPDQWGAVAARAWACSRVMDYLCSDPAIDASGVALAGSGELAKSVLWAAASDSRFSMVAALASGCGGAALSRRSYGFNIAQANRMHPNWFCDNFKKYSGNEQALPVDQHELLALIAPRLLCLTAVSDDPQSDARGEKAAFDAAAPVFRLYDAEAAMDWRLRDGEAVFTLEDWEQYISQADRNCPQMHSGLSVQ